MPKETWIVASVLTALLLVGLLGYSSWDKKVRLEHAQEELDAARAAADKDAAEAAQLRDKLADSEKRNAELQKEKEAVVQSHRSLEEEMRAALESKDVTISQLQGKLTVNILDRVLFDSGEAELKPEGASVLDKVAAVLAQHPGIKIHVIGHTDNVPIRAAARSRFASNWELSTARATAAVRYLSEKAGVEPRRLGVVGYGEFRPVADNLTAEGRAKNRRIAITILSDEVAGADTTMAMTTNAPAISLPAGGTVKTDLPETVGSTSSTNHPPED